MTFDHITTQACAVANRSPASGQVTPLIATTTPKPCGDLAAAVIDFWIEPASVRLDKNPGQLKAFVQTGETFGFWAWASYSDGTCVEVTEQANWSGNNPDAATISDTAGAKGVASGVLEAPVGGGSAEDEVLVTATWNGKTDQAVLTVHSACEDTALDMVLVLDRSGSMDTIGPGGQSRLAAVKAAASTLINNMHATRDQIGLVSYAGKVWLSATGVVTNTEGDATLDSEMLTAAGKATLLERLELYELRGDCSAANPSVCCTGIGAGMERALEELKSGRARAGAQKVMILMTDGAENINDPPPAQVAAAAKAAGMTVVVVGLDVPSTYEISLRALANPTDKAFMVGTGEDVQAIFASIPNIVCNEHISYGAEGYGYGYGNDPCLNLIILEESVAVGTEGEAYYDVLSAAGGTAPYTWEKVSGPSWLTVAVGGQLSGTPLAAGAVALTVKVTDAASCELEKVLMVNVQAAAGGGGDWSLVSLERVCEGESPADFAGPWGLFEPNGDADFHWILTVTTGAAPLVIHKLLMENTNAEGTNVRHQFWSNQDDLPPDWASRHYPLVVFENGVQLNDAYDEEITLAANQTHTLHLFGQAVIPSTSADIDPDADTAWWKATLTDADANSQSLMAANPCSDSPCTIRNFWKNQIVLHVEDEGGSPATGSEAITDFFETDFGGSAANGRLRWRIVGWDYGALDGGNQVLAGFGCGMSAGYYDIGYGTEVMPSNLDQNGQFDAGGKPIWTLACDNENAAGDYAKVKKAGVIYSVEFHREASWPVSVYCNFVIQIGCIDGTGYVTFKNYAD